MTNLRCDESHAVFAAPNKAATITLSTCGKEETDSIDQFVEKSSEDGLSPDCNKYPSCDGLGHVTSTLGCANCVPLGDRCCYVHSEREPKPEHLLAADP
ncbi:hypothetical protein CNYM01_07869 [Colletotrichum nymphaeae SA-01]|nr:hypothetical protein CNYM01_07869 [Colletotrichum nymphaeae SA-01]